MRAVIHSRYGPPDEVLSVREVDKPTVKPGDVLVRVRAASMHADVWHVIVGYPFIMRFFGNGVLKPKLLIPGTDLAGVVESVGENVTRFKVGDEVFGESAKFGWHNGGAYAEYAAVPQTYLALKPPNVTFEQAATVPTTGMIALNNLGGVNRPKTARHVLINGAGGAMGPVALQIAKADGAKVTVVDSAEKLSMLQSLGADRVIDYRSEDYLKTGERYDLILDVAEIRSLGEYQHALTPTGEYVPIGHAHYDNKTRRVLGLLPYFIWLLILGILKRKTVKFLEKPEAMEIFRALLERGALTPIVAKTCRLEDVAAAMSWMQDGKTLGRIVIVP